VAAGLQTGINRTRAAATRFRPISKVNLRQSARFFDKLLRVARRNGPITVLSEKTRIAF
jgi:hypothetical protein